MEDAARPLKDLDVKYREALEKKRTAAQQTGNLEILVAVATELDLLAEGLATAPVPKQPDLAKMRQIYRDQKARITPAVEKATLAVEQSYTKEMKQLVVDLTKAGKAEEALKVREKAEAFVKEREALRQEAAAAKSGDPADAEAVREKNLEKAKKSLAKLLVENSWSWHLDGADNGLFNIRFLETGGISGPSWLTGWEVVDADSVKIKSMGRDTNYWLFRFNKGRDKAESVPAESTIKDNKAIKRVKS